MTVTASYGVLYYAFAVLSPTIVAQTGWSAPAVTAAFSGGALVGSAAGVVVGRVLQRRGPRAVMTAGSLLGAAAVTLLALAPSFPGFCAAWVLIGLASTGTYYPPAFAALTQWFGADRVRAITVLTLAAGFASTVFAPLTGALAARLGWRGTYLVFAVVLLGTALVHAVALRLPWHGRPDGAAGVPDHEVVTSRSFVVLATATTLASLAMWASLVHLVPLLTERGLDAQTAAWVLGLSGAGQVAGRLLYPVLDRRLGPRPRTGLVVGLVAVTLAGLAVAPGAWAVGVAVTAGAARGLFTLSARRPSATGGGPPATPP